MWLYIPTSESLQIAEKRQNTMRDQVTKFGLDFHQGIGWLVPLPAKG
jgi:hypothetical protein